MNNIAEEVTRKLKGELEYFVKPHPIRKEKDKHDWHMSVDEMFGWGNGYVLLPKTHSCYGKGYDDIHCSAHGGLTFSEEVRNDMITDWGKGCLKKHHIGLWLIGFDTGHAGDSLRIWPKERVIEETKQLARQLYE